MADNDNRNPWLDWGEPVEQTRKSWDEWGEPVEQTGKSWDEWGEPAPERTPVAPTAPVLTPETSTTRDTSYPIGGPSSTIPPTITREYIDEDGEKRHIIVSNPEYERAVREEQNENPESNSGGIPLQSGVGNSPVGAGGGSPSTGGGSGSAANTTWETEVIQQYSDEIPNYGSDNPDNVPKTIMQPYKDSDGEIRYREVTNPAYYSSQTRTPPVGNNGGLPSTFTGTGTGTGYNKKTDYYSDYAAAHKAIKNSNYRYSAEGLRSDVETLQSYYDNVINCIDGWTGMSSNSYKNAANSIRAKLTVVMDNINESLLPACEAAEDLDELLTRLEDEDENLHLLLEELNEREVDYQAALSAYNREPSTITETTTNPITGEKETKSVPNPRKETLRLEMNSAKELLDLITKKVEEQQKLEAELCEEIEEKIELIRTLQSKIRTMNSYVNPRGSNYYSISTHENLNNNYDAIVNDLDFSSPSIPNPSVYHDGDNVAFDDSYGEVITITQGHGNGGTGGGSIPIVTNGGPSISNDVAPAYDYPMITDAPTPPVEPPTSK